MPGLDSSNAVLRLQEYMSGQGITDIEIEAPGRFHIIIEAKRGCILPSREQLDTYAARATFAERQAPIRRLVVLSECSAEYAHLHLPAQHIGGAPIVALSWRTITSLAATARASGTHAEKRLLEALDVYLRGLMTMQRMNSNWVYVVDLSHEQAPGWGCSWIEIVTQHHNYFHPVGAGWPKEPLNYIAFRYDGQLQSIHHIEGYEVTRRLYSKPETSDGDDSLNTEDAPPHYLYTLGPAFRPNKTVRTGAGIYMNAKVWCMLDTLFTADTIAEARDISQARAAHAGESNSQV